MNDSIVHLTYWQVTYKKLAYWTDLTNNWKAELYRSLLDSCNQYLSWKLWVISNSSHTCHKNYSVYGKNHQSFFFSETVLWQMCLLDSKRNWQRIRIFCPSKWHKCLQSYQIILIKLFTKIRLKLLHSNHLFCNSLCISCQD